MTNLPPRRGDLVRLRTLPADLRVLGCVEAAVPPGVPTVAVGWHTPTGEFRRAYLPADALETCAQQTEESPA